MSTQMVFSRIEKKYLIPADRFEAFRSELDKYMISDKFASYTIRNIYFDTPDYAFIRTSLSKPVYKEKFRLRTYGAPDDVSAPVFAEVKKKYKGVVTKRRCDMTRAEAEALLADAEHYAFPTDSQRWREIAWLFESRKPQPMVYLAYDRVALKGREDSELRITFDRNLRWRNTGLSFHSADAGAICGNENILMEIKFPLASPLWLAHLLAKYELYPTSFSKYGECYKRYLSHFEGKIIPMDTAGKELAAYA
ncbi:MAG: polyphosphate polymerase domain-containing protein [Oscillospiraceae bacterium]|nr:polyphosphate polymerase domain-containing protein [Oscillospiraceae bacterium]